MTLPRNDPELHNNNGIYSIHGEESSQETSKYPSRYLIPPGPHGGLHSRTYQTHEAGLTHLVLRPWTNLKTDIDISTIIVLVDAACPDDGFFQEAAGIGIYFGMNSIYNRSARITVENMDSGLGATLDYAHLCATYQALEEVFHRFDGGGVRNVIISTNSKFVYETFTDRVFEWKSHNWKDEYDDELPYEKTVQLVEEVIEEMESKKWRVKFCLVGKRVGARMLADKLANDALGRGSPVVATQREDSEHPDSNDKDSKVDMHSEVGIQPGVDSPVHSEFDMNESEVDTPSEDMDSEVDSPSEDMDSEVDTPSEEGMDTADGKNPEDDPDINSSSLPL